MGAAAVATERYNNNDSVNNQQGEFVPYLTNPRIVLDFELHHSLSNRQIVIYLAPPEEIFPKYMLDLQSSFDQVHCRIQYLIDNEYLNYNEQDWKTFIHSVICVYHEVLLSLRDGEIHDRDHWKNYISDLGDIPLDLREKILDDIMDPNTREIEGNKCRSYAHLVKQIQ